MEGIFRIIDRATAPMARMERQAKQTDRAIARLGLTTDAIGTPRQQRNISETDKVIRNFGNSSDVTSRKVGGLNKNVGETESRMQRLRRATIEVGTAIRSFGAILGLLRLPAIGVAIGVLVQAVGALAGGVIALTPRIASLGGVLAALPVTLVGIVGSMVTLKFATADLSQALGGNQQAMKRLTPEAKAFLKVLQEYRPVMKELRSSAQQGLFPGLTVAVARLQRGVPIANTLLRSFGRTLGNLAAQAATRFTTPGFLQDLLGIGQAGNRVTNRGGTAILNLASAFRHLTVAAIPFTDWLSKMAVHASKFIERWALYQRDSGRFGAFLNRTKDTLRLFGNILKNVWTWVTALARAAKPLGDLLWRDAERATRAWSKYANSTTGQIRLTRQFLQMRPAIHEIFTLFDNLVRAVFRMGSQPALPGIVRTLDKMVPVVETLLNTLVSAFGPVMADLVMQLANTLQFLVAATGPLAIMLTLIDRILAAVNGLIGAVPGLGRVFAAALSVIAIGYFIAKVEKLAAGWWAVATGARAAAAAEALATGGVAGVGAGGAAAALAAGGAAAAGGSWVRAGAKGAMVWEPAAAAAATGAAAKLGFRGGARAIGTRLAGAAGKFALPITAAMAAYGGITAQTSGGIGNSLAQRALGAGNTLTFGLLGRLPAGRGSPYGSLNEEFATPAQHDARAVNALLGRAEHRRLTNMGGDAPNYNQLSRQVILYQAVVAAFGAKHSEVFTKARNDARTYLQGLKAVQKAMEADRNQRSRAAGYKEIRQEGAAFDIYAKKFGDADAGRRTNADALKAMASITGPGRRVIADQRLAWLYEEQKSNKKLIPVYKEFRNSVLGFYTDVGAKVKIVNGQIVNITATSWAAIAKSIETSSEHAKEVTETNFTAIQNKAVAVLTGFGVSRASATKIVQGMESGNARTATTAKAIATQATTGQYGPVAGEGLVLGGGGPVIPHPAGGAGERARLVRAASKKALGGRITGDYRGGDQYALGGNLVGGGELVVNRHTERKVNHILAGRATLGGMVAGEGTPHSFATGGRVTGDTDVNAPMLAALEAMSAFSGIPINIASGYRSEAEQAGLFSAAIAKYGSASAAGKWVAPPGRSRHNLGIAADISPGVGTFGGMAARFGLNFPMSWEPWHIEFGGGGAAIRGGGGAGSYGMPSITAAQLAPAASGLGGVPGVLADQAGLLMAGGMAAHLNEVPWFGDGANFRARRPMLIGVGDKDEHVSITRTGKAGGRGVVLQVKIGTIVNHQPGDIRQIVHDEFEALARQLEGDSDGGLIG